MTALDKVALNALAAGSWIDNDVARGWCRRAVVDACAAAGFQPTHRSQTHDCPTALALALVAAGLGISVMPSLGARTLPDTTSPGPDGTPRPGGAGRHWSDPPAGVDNDRMGRRLLERAGELESLRQAVADTTIRHGVAVLVSGEAGMGKTTLVHELATHLPRGMPLYRGGCDDLMAAHPLGAVREAFRDAATPVRDAVQQADIGSVLEATVAALRRGPPGVLLIEDVHWADEATVDVLCYLGRRLSSLPLMMLLTVRADEIGPEHHVQRLLAALTGQRLTKIELAPLSLAAVAALTDGTTWSADTVLELTGGNPFFVTETVAASGDGAVPASVADAVLVRVRALPPQCREALELLSVIPGAVSHRLSRDLLGDRLTDLTPAESRGILRIRDDALVFRHELARRATLESLPALRRRELHRRVCECLRVREPPDLPRVLHHAVLGGADEVVAALAPTAGRAAAGIGAHREALTHFAAALDCRHLLSDRELATVLDEHAWELYNAFRFTEAVEEAREAVLRFHELDDHLAEAQAQLRLSRHLFMVGDIPAAEEAVDRAVTLMSGLDLPGAQATAAAAQGTLAALVGDPESATSQLRRAREHAVAAARTDLVSLCDNYRALADPGLDAAARIALLQSSLDAASATHDLEPAARARTNLAEMLYRYHRDDELDAVVTEGLDFAREHGFWSHAFNLDVHHCLLLMRRGQWVHARAGLERAIARCPDPGMLELYAVPPYGRLLARIGDPRAEGLLRHAWERALAQRSVIGLGYAATAVAEWSWLTGRPEVADEVRHAWLPHRGRPTAEPLWAELERHCVRAGLEPTDGSCVEVEPWASGLRGDWRSASDGWLALGDRYESALELAESPEVSTRIEALGVLDELGATQAAWWLRSRLRAAGVPRVPRGPVTSTRRNPAQLTDREMDVLELVAQGLSNREIATRLILSVRTVDHHVSSLLAKLDAGSRREAAQAFEGWHAAE